MSVSRSNLYERPTELQVKRGSYTKLADVDLLAVIVKIVDQRPTYGYRRVTALVNRELKDNNMSPVNHKRIYRLMRLHGLLLTRIPHPRETRQHTGKIITAESDLRWCSDGFELTCDNGQKVRTIFVLDCCDREIISYTTSTSGYTAEMAQDALLQAVERRFCQERASHCVEWLTDNGSCFTAKDTLFFAKEIGIINCFTPVRSPESNGMAEAFVKTLKRDYADCHHLPNAKETIKLMAAWIEDYNENAPHKGLKLLSPRQFRRKAKELSGGNFPGAARLTKAA